LLLLVWATSKPLLFEKLVESLSHIVALYGLRAATRSQRNARVRFEVFAKVGLQLVLHIIGLRFSTLIAPPGIKEPAIFATMHVGIAMRTFVPTLDFAYDFDFTPTVVTNHNAPRKRLKKANRGSTSFRG
jgi:hypothetical protein